MKIREIGFRFASVVGAAIGYGCLGAFLYLVGVQAYRWFRDGGWTPIGLNDGLRVGLLRRCFKGDEAGRLAEFMRWLDAPTNWLGLHKVVEVMPASLALFVLSIAGNCLFLYCRDRLDRR